MDQYEADMAPLNVSQATDSTFNMQLTDQDLPNEAPADSDDNFYTRWVNAINMYMSQPIKASWNKSDCLYSQWLNAIDVFLSEAKDSSKADVQTAINQTYYEPEDFIPRGPEFGYEVN